MFSFDQIDIDALVREAVTSSIDDIFGPLLEDEKKLQHTVSKKSEEFRATEGETDEEIDEEEEAPTGDDSEKKPDTGTHARAKNRPTVDSLKPEEIEKITLEKIVKMLNTMRAGKSLKDKATNQRFKEYFNSLSIAERKSLAAFLEGLSQILVLGEEGKDATQPSDIRFKVRTSAEVKPPAQSPKTSPEKRTVAARGQVDPESGQAPIIVGELACKTDIFMRLNEIQNEN